MKLHSAARSLVRVMAPVLIGALLLSPTSAFAKTQLQGGPLNNLNPLGDKIHMGLASFPTNGGLYILQCLNTVTASKTKDLCNSASQLWISTSPGASFTPTGMDIVLNVSGSIAGVDCGADKCAIFLTYDHTQPADRGEDQLIPISFAAGVSTPTKPKDVIIATIAGKELSTSIPATLAYRTPVTISASAKSASAITFASSTPDCTVVNGVITALKATAACDITVSTAGNLEYQATTAHYPFLLSAGVQKIALTKSSIKVGKTINLPATSNFQAPITYSTNGKNCSVKGVTLKALKKGSCLLIASAPAEGTLWKATSIKKTIKIL